MCLKRNNVHCVCRDGKCAQDGTYASTPAPIPLKLEVGKTYVTRGGNTNVVILFKDGDAFVGRPDRVTGNYRRYEENGQMRGYSPDPIINLVKEYKEPKVIQHDIVLWLNGLENTMETCIKPVGHSMSFGWPSSREISRQTVTFTVTEE